MKHLISFILFFILIGLLPFSSRSQSTNPCFPNIDFEQGNFNHWQTFWGYGTTAMSPPTCLPPPDTIRWHFHDTTALPSQQIISAATYPPTDIRFGNMPKLCPNGGNYSILLGDSMTILGGCPICPYPSQARQDGVYYKAHIPANTQRLWLKYWFANILHEVGLGFCSQASFWVMVLDSAQPNRQCFDFVYTDHPTNGNLSIAAANKDGIDSSWLGYHLPNIYKKWTSRYLNLSRYAGRTVYLYFMNVDGASIRSGGGGPSMTYFDVEGCTNTTPLPTVYCAGSGQATITAPFGYDSYTWMDSSLTMVLDTNQNFVLSPVSVSGSHTYAVIVQNRYSFWGCPDTLWTTLPAPTPMPTATFSIANSTCPNQKQMSYTGSASAAATYHWNFGGGIIKSGSGQGAYVVHWLSSGKKYISLTVTDNGCSSTFKDSVVVSAPISITNQVAICPHQFYTLPNGLQTDTAGVYYDTLQSHVGCDSLVITQVSLKTISTESIAVAICQGHSYTLPNGGVVNQAGTYTDTLQNYLGCDSIISVQLSVINNQQKAISASICNNQTYTLPKGEIVNMAGVYQDTLKTYLGCDSFINTTLTIVNSPMIDLGQDTSLCRGNGLVLKASYPNATYIWNDGSTQATQIALNSGTYVVQVTESPCAPITDSIRIHFIDCSCDMLMPNAFTPNNDNKDDDIKPIYACDLQPLDYSYKIFNRWGQLVFQTTDYTMAWDGTFNGKPQPIATYVYFINWKNASGDAHLKKGDVSLVR